MLKLRKDMEKLENVEEKWLKLNGSQRKYLIIGDLKISVYLFDQNILKVTLFLYKSVSGEKI